MRSYPVKIPSIVRNFFPGFEWSADPSGKSVYLTIDDGPTEALSPFLLDTLDSFGVKATMFCVGENLSRFASQTERMLKSGHQLCNHTQNHLNGWKTGKTEYMENIDHCRLELEKYGVSNNLFRPPYGRILPSQARQLRAQGLRIVMWDLLSGDFDSQISPENCLNRTVKNTEPGSIVVFHDNIKCDDTIRYALPRYLEQILAKGYQFKLL